MYRMLTLLPDEASLADGPVGGALRGDVVIRDGRGGERPPFSGQPGQHEPVRLPEQRLPGGRVAADAGFPVDRVGQRDAGDAVRRAVGRARTA
jgi:hypothetical protein